ncbi:hypothetical protein FH715_24885 [Streptomyces sedi]|uniref:Pyrrolo-quinoline quinone repeat domain-containing protein n=2 Tax=Streptomyces sedi TaxID=555059 RepID=A0A5C4USX2_9ACTN|nr:hypothetical protein FH715_24885 [Streptomyces sedi]
MTRLWETEMDGDLGTVELWVWKPDGGPLVVVSDEELVGIDPETGAEEWSLQAPRGEFCERSFEANDDGVGAVMYGSGSECLTLAAVDAYSGEMLWETELEKDHPGDRVNPGGEQESVVVGGDTISVAFGYRVVRVDAGRGEHLAPLRAPWGPECPEISWRHADTNTLAFGDCSEGGPEIAAFDTESGERLWVRESAFAGDPHGIRQLLPGPDVAVSADRAVYLFDETGEQTGWIPLTSGTYAPVVYDSTLIFRDARGVSAYDLRSGELLWEEVADTQSRKRVLGEDGPASIGITIQRGAPFGADVIGLGSGEVTVQFTWWDPRTGESTREEIQTWDSSAWGGASVVHEGVFYQGPLHEGLLTAYQFSD